MIRFKKVVETNFALLALHHGNDLNGRLLAVFLIFFPAPPFFMASCNRMLLGKKTNVLLGLSLLAMEANKAGKSSI